MRGGFAKALRVSCLWSVRYGNQGRGDPWRGTAWPVPDGGENVSRVTNLLEEIWEEMGGLVDRE